MVLTVEQVADKLQLDEHSMKGGRWMPKYFSVVIPDDLASAVDHQAKKETRSRNNMIEVLLTEALKKRKDKKDGKPEQGNGPGFASEGVTDKA